MTAYGFQSKARVERLNRFAKTLETARFKRAQPGRRNAGFDTPCLVFKTPAGGIPARSGTSAGKAQCDPISIALDGQMRTATGKTWVYNPFGSAIAGSTYIVATLINEVMVIVAEDC